MIAFNRHPGENRGPGYRKLVKALDSGFRRNDLKRAETTFSTSLGKERMGVGAREKKIQLIGDRD